MALSQNYWICKQFGGLQGGENSRIRFQPWQLKWPILGLARNEIRWTGLGCTQTGDSFYAASNLCHNSSIVLDGEGWRASLSAIHDMMFSMGNRSGDHGDQGSSQMPCVSRKVRKRRTKCIILLEDGVSKIGHNHWGVRCHKCTDLRSNYHQHEIELCLSCTQWMPKP